MKVLVLNNMVPFIYGGAEILFDALTEALRRRRGVQVEAMRVPFGWVPTERVIEEIVLARSLEITGADRVICLKFPMYLVQHRAKVLWVLHQYRQCYDLFDAGQSHFVGAPGGDVLRHAVRTADNRAFAESRALFCNAEETARRMRHYNGFSPEVLTPPLLDAEIFTGGESQGYILASGRVNDIKRQHLLIRALRHAPGVNLIVAGPPDDEATGQRLRTEAVRNGVQDRVVLDLRFLSRGELAQYVNHALAVAYLPFEEDSMGYVTMEAFQASKSVITASDTGGVLEIVHDGETGLVVEPTPEALGQAMAQMAAHPMSAERMGRAAHRLWTSLGVNWTTVTEKLLA